MIAIEILAATVFVATAASFWVALTVSTTAPLVGAVAAVARIATRE